MKNWLYLFALACCIACAPLPSEAGSLRMHGTYSAPVPSCADFAVDNGCAASPGGDTQVSNWFSNNPGGRTYSQPNVNYCGITYACGVPVVANPSWSASVVGATITGSCAKSTLVDPELAVVSGSLNDPGCGILPVNCSWQNQDLSTNGVFLRSTIQCTGTGQGAGNPVVIKGFNLKATAGHSATYIQYNSSVTNKKIRAFNYLEMDAAIYGSNGWVNIVSGSSGDTATIASTIDGKYLSGGFNARGAGTATYSGITVTISACSVCAFYRGQILSGFSGNRTIITRQVSGAAGGVGVYEGSESKTAGATAVTSNFATYGGEGLNTSDSIVHQWNALIDANSRGFGAFNGGSGSGSPRITDELALRYNFVNNVGMDTNSFHFEMAEYVLANGNGPKIYNNMIGDGNVFGGAPWAAAASVTAMYFASTGAVAAPKTSDWSVTYSNLSFNYNVGNTPAGAAGSTGFLVTGGSFKGTASIVGNYFDKFDATNYASCSGAPEINDVNPTSFIQASQLAAAGTTMTVITFQGGQPLQVGYHVYESGRYILSQLTNTEPGGDPGKAGTYQMDGAANMTSGSRRAAPDGFSSAPTVSGNFDLNTGSPVADATFFRLQTILSPCMYPGRTQ